MSKSLFEQLVEAVERDLPDWEWLVRSNKKPGSEGAYFANLIRQPQSRPLPGNEGVMMQAPFMKCPHYADTKEQALCQAYLQAMGVQHELNEAGLVLDMVVDRIKSFFGGVDAPVFHSGGVFDHAAFGTAVHKGIEEVLPPSHRLRRLASQRG